MGGSPRQRRRGGRALEEPVTRDGCPVDLYRRLPYAGEVEVFAAAIPAGAAVLELGCGAGRITRALLERGYRVTAVDNSEAMLACLPPGVDAVLSDIESLDLPARFDVVLLASCLVNAPGSAAGEMLAACRRHVAADGALVLQRNDPQWLLGAPEGLAGRMGGIAIVLERATRRGDLAEMCVRYEEDGRVWRHPFIARALDDAAVERLLDEAAFCRPQWLDARRLWALARPSGDA